MLKWWEVSGYSDAEFTTAVLYRMAAAVSDLRGLRNDTDGRTKWEYAY
jgi:hypothetical protein